MGVKVKLLGREVKEGVGKDEYDAGKELQQVFIEEFKNKDVDGVILIKPNFKALGQSPEDIDIVIWMNFDMFKYDVFTGYRTKKGDETITVHETTKQGVNFSSILLAIELKSHDNSGVKLTNNDVFVRYNNRESSALDQSNGQKYSLVSYLRKVERQLSSVNPRVNNLVWLKNISGMKPWGCQVRNVIIGRMDFKRLIETAFEHDPPFKPNNSRSYRQSSFNEDRLDADADANLLIENILLDYEKEIILKQGDLSRRKLENVVQKQLEGENLKIYEGIGEKTTIIKGVPGSGKTINLLHYAYHLAANRGERCLILTYNKALIADINRLATLCGFKDDPSSATVGTNTCMRLMRSLLIAWGIYEEEPGNLSKVDRDKYFKNNFLDKYQLLLKELLKYLEITEVNEIEEMKNSLLELNWKTLLIDESQDWYEEEKLILYLLFGAENCVVAYGSHQLLRNKDPLNWLEGTEKFQIQNLKTSYRQKSNLCYFIKDVSSSIDLKDEIEVNSELLGGTIHLYNRALTVRDYEHHFNYCVTSCKNAGYDILVLVNSNDNFLKSLKSENVLLHDGTIDSNKIKKPDNMDSCRVFNYQSCRGLEGWVVIANNIDLFLEQMANSTTTPIKDLSLDETKRIIIAQWLYMILSRPIDRLVISLSNPQSEYGQLLLKVANTKTDYCSIYN